MYYWDGQRWVSTLSPDGRHRWSGVAWVPVLDRPFTAASGTQARDARTPTSWTRPLQLAVAAWYVWSVIYALSIPLWMGGMMNTVVDRYIANQEAIHPDQPLPPAGFTEGMHTSATIGMWLGVAILVAVYAVALIGTSRRWTWIFYAILVLLGLGALLLPLDIFDAAIGQRASATSALAMPAGYYVFSSIAGLPGVALFAWMLIALLTRGPWAMRRATY